MDCTSLLAAVAFSEVRHNHYPLNDEWKAAVCHSAAAELIVEKISIRSVLQGQVSSGILRVNKCL